MQKIINGKLYDTTTSELVYTGYDTTRKKRRDYYKTNKGAYFCHYVTVGKFELVDELTMMEILAEYDTAKYIELFGDVEEG